MGQYPGLPLLFTFDGSQLLKSPGVACSKFFSCQSAPTENQLDAGPRDFQRAPEGREPPNLIRPPSSSTISEGSISSYTVDCLHSVCRGESQGGVYAQSFRIACSQTAEYQPVQYLWFSSQSLDLPGPSPWPVWAARPTRQLWAILQSVYLFRTGGRDMIWKVGGSHCGHVLGFTSF